jgi:adenylylsulfate kinase
MMHREEGVTLWFTGLSGAGKSTLSSALAEELRRRGRRVEVLDGDEVRQNLSKGLGFSREDRETNIRRIAFVAGLLSRNGVIVITATISPYQSMRDDARRCNGSRFVEVFLDCPIEELVRRDVKGLWARALRGEVENFTGLSDPYEPPEHPDIHVRTDRESIADSREKVLRWLEQRGLLAPMP